MERFIRRAAFLLIVAMGIPVSLRPHQQPQRPAEPPQQEVPVFRSSTDLVNLLCAVRDKKGRLINTLEKGDFHIFEDGKPQEIRYFNRESALPLTVGMLIDTSYSQHRLVPVEQQAGAEFFSTVIRDKDMAFLISFDMNIDLLQDMTNSHRLLERGLGQLRVGAGGPSSVGMSGPFPTARVGGTHLFDAVYLAAAEKLTGEVGRKAVIVVSDGEDQGSKLKVEQAIEAAQKADVVIYGVYFVDYEFYRNSGGFYGGGGQGVLKKMAEETGGRVVTPNREGDLRRAYQEISEELRSQYSIGYSPANPKRDGSFRKIEIKLSQSDYKAQTRKGYYAVASSGN